MDASSSSVVGQPYSDSEHSFQNNETDYVMDTSDTSSSTLLSPVPSSLCLSVPSSVEISNPSTNATDSENMPRLDNTSSISDNVVKNDNINPPRDSDRGNIDGEGEEGLQHRYKRCIQCDAENHLPSYPYCGGCFSARKRLFPPRPNTRRRNKRKLFGEEEEAGPSTVTAKRRRVSTTDEIEKVNNDDANPELCIICCERRKSAVFVHGKISHVCCCYECAMKTWRINKRCPVCNTRVSNVIRVCIF